MGAITCDEASTQVMIRALRIAPAYTVFVNWCIHAETAAVRAKSRIIGKIFITKTTKSPFGPVKGIKPQMKSGTY